MNAKPIALLAAVALSVAACDVTPKARPASEAPPVAPATRPSTLRSGDKIDLKFFYAPELNDSQTIRPDGQITLQLLGDVQAAGLTANELAENVKDAYGTQLKYPQCTVILREAYLQKIYVAGEVQKPGLLDMPADMNVMQAVFASGGFNTTFAQTKQVLVIRQEGKKHKGYSINVEDALLGGEHEPFMLQPQDIVYVPRTPITNVDNWVDQYISKIIPQTGFILFNAN